MSELDLLTSKLDEMGIHWALGNEGKLEVSIPLPKLAELYSWLATQTQEETESG